MSEVVSRSPVPTWLATACDRGVRPSDDVEQHVGECVTGRREVSGGLAGEVATWIAQDFRRANRIILAGELRAHRASLLFHATLLGLARGASRDAFAYARVRKIGGEQLIDCDLIAARLSTIATNEVIANLQFARLCGIANHADADADAERELSRRELERTAIAVVVESAHVHGGRGYLQEDAPGKRVEIAQSVIVRLSARE